MSFLVNGHIDWKFIEALLKTQDLKKLHLRNKLSSAHVYYQKNKMKVKLAAQLFSDGVADAIP